MNKHTTPQYDLLISCSYDCCIEKYSLVVPLLFFFFFFFFLSVGKIDLLRFPVLITPNQAISSTCPGYKIYAHIIDQNHGIKFSIASDFQNYHGTFAETCQLRIRIHLKTRRACCLNKYRHKCQDVMCYIENTA